MNMAGEPSLVLINYVFYTVAFRLAAGDLPSGLSSLAAVTNEWCQWIWHFFTSAQKIVASLRQFFSVSGAKFFILSGGDHELRRYCNSLYVNFANCLAGRNFPWFPWHKQHRR